jgi:hypothetical protein
LELLFIDPIALDSQSQLKHNNQQPSNQATKQPSNQATKQPTNQSTNQPTNHQPNFIHFNMMSIVKDKMKKKVKQ